MADFQTCYFCGAGPSDAIEEVGVVPSAFDPTDDQQRSVALCPDCRDKLTAVMEAVVEAGGTDGATTPDESTTSGSHSRGEPAASGSHSQSEPAATGEAKPDVHEPGDGEEPADEAADATDPAGTADGAGATGAGTDGETGIETAGNRDTDVGGDRETGTDTSGNRETGTGTGGDRETGPDTLADAVADERDVEGGPEDRVADEEPAANVEDEDEPGIARNEGTGVSFSTATAGDEGAEGDDGGDETPPQRPTGAASVGQGGDDDPMDGGSEAYRQVIRLLQNREFPVQRDEIEEVATSAYELSPAETASAIDAIVRKGLLVEENGVLRRDRSQ